MVQGRQSSRKSRNKYFTYRIKLRLCVSSNVIDELFRQKFQSRTSRTFFFCEFDNAKSLTARTVLGSIIKQLLDSDNLPNSIETQLGKIMADGSPDVEDLQLLFEEALAISQINFIIIDAIDECAKVERVLLLNTLQAAVKSTRTTTKIFIATRPDLGLEIRNAFTSHHHISMNSSGLHADIATYIKAVTMEKEKSGDLKVGDPELLTEIQDKLIEGAQGMLVLTLRGFFIY